MRNIKKSIFLNSMVCPSLGWLMRRDLATKTPTIGEQFFMDQGMDIERRARELYPDGILIDERDVSSALQKSKEFIADKGTPAIFSALFRVGNYTTRSDILIRKDDESWKMIEVKSSINDKPEFVEDMAYTTMVMRHYGLDVSSISLLLISKDYRLGMRNDDLFKEIDHTKNVLKKVEEYMLNWDRVDKITGQEEKPKSELMFECRKCPLFKDCLGNRIENHIFDIPRLSNSKFKQLNEQGIVSIEDIPPDFKLTSKQDIIKKSVQSKNPYLGDGLDKELESITWPTFYLDFETLNTAIPLYPGIAPYTQIPTQYSIHLCSEPGIIIDQSQYLADHRKDCRRELAENLIRQLDGEGSIVVYSHFEKRIVNYLLNEFPDLSSGLNSIIERLVNLQAIIDKNYYHPEFHGSISIKNVAPALIPEISYEDLVIKDGTSAMAVFAYMAQNKYDEAKINKIREDLNKYCIQDSYSLVKLHQNLCECL